MSVIQEKIEALWIALNSLKTNKTRGILTTLGIVIGIVAVSTTMTAANGLANNFRESISAIGSDVLYVTKIPWIVNGNFFELRNRPNLTLKDSQKLRRRLSTAMAVNPVTGTQKNVRFQSNVMESVNIIGTTDKYTLVTDGLPEYGRFLMPYDIQFRKRVCVIGNELKERLFKNSNPLNKEIRIGWYDFLVVGIMEKRGSASFFGGPNFDNQIFVPITSFQKFFGGQNRNYTISVKAPNQEEMENFRYDLIGEMRKIRKLRPVEEDNFAINTMDTLINAYNNVMGVVVMIGLIITGISLFVGGIGVMNIMFVSVTERTREIGIRKAIGARRRSILTQFLLESCTICLLGGIMGVIISFGIAALMNAYLLPASVSLPIIGVALFISMLTGVLAGFIPAFRASRLDPIMSLRYE